MKKFLTVLLVISVMFTFSFGTAFAAVSADEAGMNAVLEQQEDMAEAVNKYAASVVYNQKGYVAIPAGYENLPKAAVDAAVAEVIANLNQALIEKEIELVADGVFNAADEAALKAVWEGKDWAAVVFADVEDGALYTTAVDALKATFTAKVDAVKVDDYANKAVVKKAVEDAQAALKAAKNTKAGLEALVAADAAFDAAMKDQITVANQEAKLAEAKEKAVAAVKEAADKYYEAKAAELEKIIEANASPASVAAATAELAVLSGNVDKVAALYVGRIEAVAMDDDTTYAEAVAKVTEEQTKAIGWALTDAGVKSVIAQYADVDMLVKYAETLTSTLKTQYDQKTGLATYNAATVDAALADIVKKIESLDGTAATYDQIQKLVNAIPTAAQEKVALATKVEAGVKAITTGDYAAAKWDGENKDAVEAIQEDYTAQIKAAATADEIDALVKAAKKAMDAYLTTAQTKTVEAAVKSVVTSKKVDAALKAYAEGVAAKNSAATYTAAIKNAAVEQAIEVFVDAAVALQDADLTTKEIEGIIDANYAAALAAKWDGENKDAVEAIQEDYTAQIKAAATADEIDALVKAAKKAMDAYLTTAQTKTVEAAVKSVVTSKKVDAALKAYAEGVAAKNSAATYTAAIKNAAVEQAIEVFVDAAVALQDADLTTKEIEGIIDANYAAALAVIDGMKTADELKAEAKAVEDAIKALPTTATLENKAEYMAALDMLNAYLENAGATKADVKNATLLATQVKKIVRLEREAVEKMIRELPRTITLADKEAVEAARAAVKAYDDTYEDIEGYAAVSNLTTLERAETALSNAMMTEAAKLIAALPADVKAADKAAVEAARAAYDALYDADKATFDKASAALVAKLEAAEKALKIELAYSVESLKITASSAVKKGSITVKWTVKGDTTGVEGYEIWKSTKKNSGYKKAFTTTKMSYKNTKGLKKGTRYYYKVRAIAYNAEGAKIKSDWSNKAYRVAK